MSYSHDFHFDDCGISVALLRGILCYAIAPERRNGVGTGSFHFGLSRVCAGKWHASAASFPIMSQFTVVGNYGTLRMERLDAVHRLVGATPAPGVVYEQVRRPFRPEIARVERITDMKNRIVADLYFHRHDIAF